MPFNIIHPQTQSPRPNICSNLMMVGLFQHFSRISESFCLLIVCPSLYLLYFLWPNSYWFVRYCYWTISSFFVSCSFLQFRGNLMFETWSDLSESYNSLLPPQLMRSWWHYSASSMDCLWKVWRCSTPYIYYFYSASMKSNDLNRWMTILERIWILKNIV